MRRRCCRLLVRPAEGESLILSQKPNNCHRDSPAHQQLLVHGTVHHTLHPIKPKHQIFSFHLNNSQGFECHFFPVNLMESLPSGSRLSTMSSVVAPLAPTPLTPSKFRVVARTSIPARGVAGPYPGEFRFGRDANDELHSSVDIKVLIYQFILFDLLI